ncbi:MAG: ABC transporter substrate-binding protein, partial [Pseudomonadota bacterium]|nr:ABC transporter substrate-binding protein [Pseudomonadota bacterium]
AGTGLDSGNMTLRVFPHGRPEWVRGLVFNTRRPLFQDRRVRQALTMVLDFSWLNRTLFHNAYVRTASYYPNSELAATGLPTGREREILETYRKNLPPEIFTEPFTMPVTDGSGPAALRPWLRQARILLANAGWHMQNGQLVNEQGEPFRFGILLVNPSDEPVALEFVRGLKRLGIEATIRTVDTAQYQGRIDESDFDMTVNKWLSTLSPGNEQITFWGSDYTALPGSRNYPGIRDGVVDALARSISAAATRGELVATVRALDRVLLWGYYIVPLYHAPGDRIAWWKPLRHPDTTPIYGPVLDSWWIQEHGAKNQ